MLIPNIGMVYRIATTFNVSNANAAMENWVSRGWCTVEDCLEVHVMQGQTQRQTQRDVPRRHLVILNGVLRMHVEYGPVACGVMFIPEQLAQQVNTRQLRQHVRDVQLLDDCGQVFRTIQATNHLL
jgi:hypothetical protein